MIIAHNLKASKEQIIDDRRMVLKGAQPPEGIKKFGVEGVNRIWRNTKLRGWNEESKDFGISRGA